MVVALFVYSLRYWGYSLIANPWMALPLHTLKLFPMDLMKVAAAQYIGANAPMGLLGTLNGIARGLHHGIGKACGPLIGGKLISTTGSTVHDFRCFAAAAAAFGLLYAIYEVITVATCRAKSKNLDGAENATDTNVQGIYYVASTSMQ